MLKVMLGFDLPVVITDVIPTGLSWRSAWAACRSTWRGYRSKPG